MGALPTDRLKLVIASDPKRSGHLEGGAKTREFTGHVIWAFYNDPELMKINGPYVDRLEKRDGVSRIALGRCTVDLLLSGNASILTKPQFKAGGHVKRYTRQG